MASMVGESEAEKIYSFPQGFLWGSATSAHQIEGNNTNNDWWVAEQQGLAPYKSGAATDHYHRFEEDFDIAKSLNQNAHRLSLEWSRVEPEEGKWNENEFGHYRKVLQALRNRGLKTMVTLHHFSNPSWLAGRGGWCNLAAPELFARFAATTALRLGDLIDFYITINEPLVFIAQGYQQGLWPPFERHSYLKIIKVFNAMVKAHRLASKTIKQIIPNARIGLAANLIDYQPRHRWNPLDLLASWSGNYFWNRLFLDRTAASCDFIGVNYYFHHHVHTAPFGIMESSHEFSDVGWGIHPEGLYYVVKGVARYQKPIYITENGIADETDVKRARFIIGHLQHLAKAIQEGVDVRGYFYWSLIDNFEWERGFGPRFGLVEIDYKTMERKVRPSAKVYAEICKNNEISL